MSGEPGFEFVDAVTSDLQVRAWGATPAEVFRAAANALLAATLERPEAIRTELERTVALEEPDLELLMRAFLDELVYRCDARDELLRPRTLTLMRTPNGGMRLEATLEGERIDRDRHRLLTEVKAVTAHGLRVGPVGTGSDPEAGWEAVVTLDV